MSDLKDAGRRDAEQALREREELYRAVVEQSSEAIWIFDAGTKRVLESNARFREMFGYTVEDLASMTNYDFVDHDKDSVDHTVALMAKEAGSVPRERRYRRKDGTLIEVEVNGSLISYRNGEAVCAVARDLTERRRNEEALRKSEKRFRHLVQNVADLITLLRPDGTILYDSPAVERILGYGPEERIGTSTFEYIHEDDIERARVSFRQTVGVSGDQPVVAFRVRHKRGSWRHMEVTRANLLEDPAVGAIVANGRDVTEREETHRALEESEGRFRSVVQNSSEIVKIVDADGTLRYASPALERLLGYDPSQMVGTNVLDHVHPEDLPRVLEETEAAMRAPGTRRNSAEYRYRHADGSWRHVESAGVYLLDDPAVRGVVVNVRDVTERKAAEAKYRSLFENAAVGIFRTTPEGRYVDANPAAARIFGYGSPEELVARVTDIARQLYVDPDQRRQFVASIEEGGSVTDFESRMYRQDGSIAWVSENARAVRGPDGALLHYEGFTEDITARKEAEEALRESEEFHRAVIEQSVEAIYLFDPWTKEVLETNAAFEELTGYSGEELLEMNVYDFLVHDKEDVDLNVERHLIQEGRYVGERSYRHRDGRIVDVAASATMLPRHGTQVVCVVVRDVSERKALEEQLRRQALYDPLTGLPSRVLLLDRLEQALGRADRAGGPAAALFVDLDDFKTVNDSLGHEAGNALLSGVAGRLRGCVRPGDTVARLFGDEFAILLEPPATVDEARRVAERIMERLERPLGLGGQDVFTRCSIGIAFGDSAGDRPKDVLRRADLAMYAAKGRGKDSYEVYSPSMNSRALRRMELENDLRRAVEREEFEVHYQPIFRTSTGGVVALEALARWRHPERGWVDPEDFIALAEQTGLVRPLGRWVLESACRQVKSWRERFASEDLKVSVNFSTSQFERQADSVPKILTEVGLAPEALQLEITERSVMGNAEFALGKLRRLRDLGIGFSIDDYGTGYSCLYYLKRMPVNCLKIDRSFVAGLGKDRGDTAIVSGTIDLAHALGLEVVAEGVESEEQLKRLKDLGCDMAQGFLLSVPLRGEEVPGLLSR